MEEENNVDLSSIAFLFCSPVIFGDTAMIVSGCIEGKGKIVQDGVEKLVVLENGQARCIKKWLTTKNTLKKGKFFEKAYEKSYQLLTDEGIKSIFTFERLSLSL